jgi:monothiol glutaredoxin
MMAENSVDDLERIKGELSSAPVVLFMKGTPDFPQCGFSAQTVAALRACGAQFRHVNIFEDPELRDALKRFSNWPTYPQLYVNGELVGGCDIALEMYRNGELKALLADAGEMVKTFARLDPMWRGVQRVARLFGLD